MKAPLVEAVGEAAFYGPKIDIQMKNVLGKEETAFTVQYDFCLPARFKLAYINSKGKEEQPIVIHRSSIGALERTMALLIEHYAGAFPVWLSPVQAVVLPITDKQNKWAENVREKLKEADISTELDLDNETLGKKIRQAELQKVPYVLIVGEKEVKAKAVAIRQRGKGDIGQVKLGDFIKKISEEAKTKKS